MSAQFSPSGHMGDGKTAGYIFTDINENCRPRPPGAGGDCYRFTYRPRLDDGKLLWAGVFWAFPANNWGTRPGRTLLKPYTKVRFYAAAEPRFDPLISAQTPNLPPNLEPPITFTVGLMRPSGLPFEDQWQMSTTVNLTPTMTPYEIDFFGQAAGVPGFDPDPDNPTLQIIGAFAWVTNYTAGVTTETDPTILYLDDIVWE